MSASGAVVTHPIEPPTPLLRGWLHLVCFFLSLPAGALVIAVAESSRARASAVVYALGLTALFGVSGLYHRRRWVAARKRFMKRLDHATIFVMIAGSYTPLCVVALRGGKGTWLLAAVWLGAGAGVVMAATGVAEKKLVGLVSYIALGWVAAVAFPELSSRLGGAEFALIVIGGAVYTVGAVVLGTRWPDPFPRVFGYHEVWHVMVVAAGVCHYLAIMSVLRTPAS